MSNEVPGSTQNLAPAPVPDDRDARQWAMFAHLSGIILGFLGPLIIWLIQKDKYPFVDDQGKEALNFQITVAIALVAATILTPVLAFIGIGFLLAPAVGVANLILCIMAGIKANEGTAYRYPVVLRLVK